MFRLTGQLGIQLSRQTLPDKHASMQMTCGAVRSARNSMHAGIFAVNEHCDDPVPGFRTVQLQRSPA